MSAKIFYASGEDQNMINAFLKAQQTFKFFWRELSWEYRRIIPALDLAYVKIAFSETPKGATETIVEHMWIDEIHFDGENITGLLLNEPNELTNIEEDAKVNVPLQQISDWLFVSEDKTYGGFTIQAMRAEMNTKEREAHDNAWGLNFGNYDDILVVRDEKTKPENLIEHPMSTNMGDSLLEYIKENPNELNSKDDNGNTLLHRETIAGNKTSVEVLTKAGALVKEKNNYGKTALDYARMLDWAAIIPLLN